MANNRHYVQMVIARDEQDKREEKQKQKSTLSKLKELQRF